MASTAQQINSNQSSQNNSCAKRKKSKGSKGSFLSKWLDKTLHHDSGSFPSLDADMYVNPNVNWHTGNSQFGPGYDNYRHDMYGCMPGHTSLPAFLNHYTPVISPSDYRYVQSKNKSVQVQRPRVRKTNRGNAEEISSAPIDANHSHYFQPKTMSDSQDYTSLPPIITSTGDTNSVSDVHTNEKDESNCRRFSDPVVRGLPDVARPANGEVESDSDSESDLSGSQVGGRLLAYLLDQISSLKTANERINKELIETKAELETVRHQAFYPQAPNNFSSSNGVLDGQYSPGFLAELVRDIRDAARIREEAMYARVRAMVHERLDSGIVSAESKISDRTLEEIKCSLRASEADRRRMMDRITKLEDELRTLRLTNGQEHTENRVTNGNDEDAECERLRLRKELADMRKAKQNAEENAHKLERLVTQMRSKFNGTQPNGPESLPSDADEPIRIRRTSSSTNNSTGNLTNALNNSTNILNSTNVLSSNLHNSSTNALNSSNNLHHSSSNLINSSNNLHNSSNMLNSSTNLLNSSSNLHNSSTNILNSSHNTNNSSFGHLTNASPMVFGLVTDL